MTAIPQQIIDYLNNKADRNFRLTPKHLRFIQARIKEGYLLEDFKRVVDNMVRDWANDPTMYKYLRPETLFGNKFDGYLNMPPPPGAKKKQATVKKDIDRKQERKQWEQEDRIPREQLQEFLANFNGGLKGV